MQGQCTETVHNYLCNYVPPFCSVKHILHLVWVCMYSCVNCTTCFAGSVCACLLYLAAVCNLLAPTAPHVKGLCHSHCLACERALLLSCCLLEGSATLWTGFLLGQVMLCVPRSLQSISRFSAALDIAANLQLHAFLLR